MCGIDKNVKITVQSADTWQLLHLVPYASSTHIMTIDMVIYLLNINPT